MKRCDMIGKGLTLAALGLALAGTTARAQQTIERDTKVTGPRGRSIERDVKIQRGPGYVDRDITIKRPAGTFQRDTRIVGGPGPAFRGPGFGPRGVVVENFIGPPAVGLFGLGLAGPSFNFAFGGGPLFGPPPVVVPPPIVGPGPNVVVQPPNRYAPPSTVVVDPVAQALDRLKSFHAHSRRDACLTLGQLGDNRALPALSEKMEKDFDKEVRQAAAWALGEIGDPKASLALQKASMYDHKHEVRDVAAIAIKKLGRAPRAGDRNRAGTGRLSGPVHAPCPAIPVELAAGAKIRSADAAARNRDAATPANARSALRLALGQPAPLAETGTWRFLPFRVLRHPNRNRRHVPSPPSSRLFAGDGGVRDHLQHGRRGDLDDFRLCGAGSRQS